MKTKTKKGAHKKKLSLAIEIANKNIYLADFNLVFRAVSVRH